MSTAAMDVQHSLLISPGEQVLSCCFQSEVAAVGVMCACGGGSSNSSALTQQTAFLVSVCAAFGSTEAALHEDPNTCRNTSVRCVFSIHDRRQKHLKTPPYFCLRFFFGAGAGGGGGVDKVIKKRLRASFCFSVWEDKRGLWLMYYILFIYY